MAENLRYKGDVTCALSVSDMKASIAWYQDILGFKLLYQLDAMGWCEMETPVAGVTVGSSQVERPQVEGGATLTWGTLDIDADRAVLEGKKVRFDGPTYVIEGMVKLATFYDPDGNKMMLAQSLQ